VGDGAAVAGVARVAVATMVTGTAAAGWVAVAASAGAAAQPVKAMAIHRKITFFTLAPINNKPYKTTKISRKGARPPRKDICAFAPLREIFAQGALPMTNDN
jgi:hypothetical protein